MPQGSCGIHSRRPHCRNRAGKDRDDSQYCGSRQKRKGIERLHAKQKGLERSRQARRRCEPDSDPPGRDFQSIADHQRQYVTSLSTERHANPEFAHPLTYRKREHAENSDRRERDG